MLRVVEYFAKSLKVIRTDAVLVFHCSYFRQKEEVYAIARDLSVCLLARLLKNACMDLDEILLVDRCRDMDELINF